MSLSVESLALRRNHTATDRAENNGDPLVVKKKARKAARSNNAPAVKKGPSVSFYTYTLKDKKNLHVNS
jgi:hypothetical protein